MLLSRALYSVLSPSPTGGVISSPHKTSIWAPNEYPSQPPCKVYRADGKGRRLCTRVVVVVALQTTRCDASTCYFVGEYMFCPIDYNETPVQGCIQSHVYNNVTSLAPFLAQVRA